MATIDHRADLWALSVIAFECLTGRFPFEAPTMLELLGRITADAPPVPSVIVPDLPPEVDGWWARAVSRSIDARFQSARELALAFGGALSIAEPVSAMTLPPHHELASCPPVVRTPSDASRSDCRDGPPRRLRRFGYPLAAAGLMVALVLPLAERAYGGGARSDSSSPSTPRVEEVTGQAPRARLARMEVEPMQAAPVRTGQRQAKSPPRPAARAPVPSHARPQPKDDPDGVLGI
jgi:serine/threonine-protein kinase